MADPSYYGQSYNFSGAQEADPSSPLPGARLDVELAAVQTSTLSLVNAIKDVRRADGSLKNGIVGPDALSSALVVGFTLRGAWASGVDYNAGDGVVLSNSFYKAKVQHTSATASSPDTDSDTWAFLFTFSSIAVTDGSITAAKLDATDAANFLIALGLDDHGSYVGTGIKAVPAKAVPVDDDTFGLVDSASGNDAFKSLTWANLKAGIFSALGALLSAGTAKTAPVDADVLPLSDSADGSATKKLSWANIKATLKTYFDDVYAAKADYQPLKAILTSLAGLSVVSGDILYGSGTTALSRLAKGTDGQFLKLASGVPSWATLTAGQPVPTSSAYAKDTKALLANVSGGTVNNGSTVAGSNTRCIYFSAGNASQSATVQSGTWLNVSGQNLANNQAGDMVRTL